MSSLPTSNQIDTIKNFINNNNGIQRANRYAVTLSFPDSAQYIEEGPFFGENNTIYPSAISFGGRAINYVYDNLQGYNYGRAVPNSSKYVGGIIMTFLVTGNLNILTKFYNWMDIMYIKVNGKRSISPYMATYYSSYVRYQNMTIKFLDLNGNSSPGLGNWMFTEVYPVECMPLELSAKTDTPLLFQVVLNYREIIRSY